MTTELQTVPKEPMEVIALAVQSGADPDQLEKLLDLQERFSRNQAEKAFASAMQAAQMAMPDVVKDAANPHTKTKYALLETVQKHAKPVYQAHGFSLSYGEDDCPLENHKRTVCDVTHVGGHTRRYHLDLPVDKSGAMNAVQGCISTTSYAQRRLLCMVFNITIAGEDTDGATPAAPITAAQVAELDGILQRIEPSDRKVVLQKMLDWMEVEKISEFPSSKFELAKSRLLKTAEQYA